MNITFFTRYINYLTMAILNVKLPEGNTYNELWLIVVNQKVEEVST